MAHNKWGKSILDPHKDRITAWRAKGMSYFRVSLNLLDYDIDCSEQTVRAFCDRHNIYSPNKSLKGKAWGAINPTDVRAMRDDGMTYAKIAEQMGMTITGVWLAEARE